MNSFKIIVFCILLGLLTLTFQAKSTKQPRVNPENFEKKLKSKPTERSEPKSRRSKAVVEEEEISCECSCQKLARKQSYSVNPKPNNRQNSEKTCSGKNCKNKSSKDTLAKMQEELSNSNLKQKKESQAGKDRKEGKSKRKNDQL